MWCPSVPPFSKTATFNIVPTTIVPTNSLSGLVGIYSLFCISQRGSKTPSVPALDTGTAERWWRYVNCSMLCTVTFDATPDAAGIGELIYKCRGAKSQVMGNFSRPLKLRLSIQSGSPPLKRGLSRRCAKIGNAIRPSRRASGAPIQK